MRALAHRIAALGDRRVLVALSGGLDSSVLLHALAVSERVRGNGLRALHVHHGLHPHADAWAAHCVETCAVLGLPLQVVRVTVARDSGDGPEAAARQARHAAFETALDKDEVLALAHHRDDQAETFLLRALRASGPDGLGAMRAWRRCGRGWLWRPLLQTPRSELLAYARDHGLPWVEDPSNVDARMDRNFLRQRVLPLLRERWPHADAAFARSAALSAEAADLLDDDDAQALAAVAVADPHCLDVPALAALPAARRARVLRRWIAALGLPPLPAAGLARIDSDLLPMVAGRKAEFAWAGARVVRWRDLLHADRQREPLPSGWQVRWDGRTPLSLPDGNRLALHGAESFERELQVRVRCGGERIRLPARRHSHALKHVLQTLAVPPWQRACLPLLGDDAGNVLAAGDLVYSAAFANWLQQHGACLRWTRC